MSSSVGRLGRALAFSGLATGLLTLAGCGEEATQRQSGTLVVPLDSVERAGEAAGKKEDAAKKTKAAPAAPAAK